MPTSPTKVRPRSMVSVSNVRGRKARSRYAMPSTRRALSAMAALASRMRRRLTSSTAQQVSSTSGAPFTITRNPPPGRRWMVLIRLREESKGSSPRRGHCSSSWCLSTPSLRASSTSAVSVGSPVQRRLPPGPYSMRTSVQRAAAVRRVSRSSCRRSHTWVTVILF